MKSIRLWIAALLLGALVAAGGIALGHSLGSEAEALAAAEFDAEVARQDAEAAEQNTEAAKTALVKAETRLAGYEAPIHRDVGVIYRDGGRITARVYEEDLNNAPRVPIFITTLTVQQDGEPTLGDIPLRLEFACYRASTLHVEILGVTIPPRSDYDPESYVVSYQFLPAPERGPATESSLVWRAYQDPGQNHVHVSHTAYWFASLRQAESVEITIEGDDGESVSATFSMDGVWDTPITPNLDRCGTYW